MRNEGTIFVEQFAPNTRFNNLTVELIRSETAKLMDKMKQSDHRLKVADYYTSKLDANASQDDLRWESAVFVVVIVYNLFLYTFFN